MGYQLGPHAKSREKQKKEKPENQKTRKPENQKTRKPENQKTRKPENQKKTKSEGRNEKRTANREKKSVNGNREIKVLFYLSLSGFLSFAGMFVSLFSPHSFPSQSVLPSQSALPPRPSPPSPVHPPHRPPSPSQTPPVPLPPPLAKLLLVVLPGMPASDLLRLGPSLSRLPLLLSCFLRTRSSLHYFLPHSLPTPPPYSRAGWAKCSSNPLTRCKHSRK